MERSEFIATIRVEELLWSRTAPEHQKENNRGKTQKNSS
jgi:hypothetical protein